MKQHERFTCIKCKCDFYHDQIRDEKGVLLVVGSDVYDKRFCSKWCENEYFDNQES